MKLPPPPELGGAFTITELNIRLTQFLNALANAFDGKIDGDNIDPSYLGGGALPKTGEKSRNVPPTGAGEKSYGGGGGGIAFTGGDEVKPSVAYVIADQIATTASMRTLGTGATQAAAGNDARLSDSRPPNGAAGGDLGGTYPNPYIVASYQLLSQKDQANGYAGLTAGTKLNLVQMQEVMAIADLSDMTGKTGTATKAVVATAAGTTNKVPRFDSSGNLVDSNVSDTGTTTTVGSGTGKIVVTGADVTYEGKHDVNGATTFRLRRFTGSIPSLKTGEIAFKTDTHRTFVGK